MTTISKNVYFDVLDDIVDKYNNTVHRIIKMEPIEVMNNYYAESDVHPNKKNHKFKVGVNVRISKYKNIFAKGYTSNWSEKVFVINKSDLNGEEITASFMKKNCKKLIKKNLEQKKDLKEKVINYMSNGKDIIIHLIVGLIKKISYKNESILS